MEILEKFHKLLCDFKKLPKKDERKRTVMNIISQKRTGRILCNGDLRLIEILRVNIYQLRNLPIRFTSNNSHSINIIAKVDNQDIYQSTSTSTCTM